LAPNRSRMRSESPLPEITPMRAHISWMMINATVMGIRVQRSDRPYCAPASEYVVMPPASLSTLEVMMPGPIRAKKMPMDRQNPLPEKASKNRWVFCSGSRSDMGAVRLNPRKMEDLRSEARRGSNPPGR